MLFNGFLFSLFLSEFFMPGLVDTHIHAPQYAFAGSNVDLPLLDWLNKYTFPTEKRFQSTDVAEEVYTRVVVSIVCKVLCDACSSVQTFISRTRLQV